jgi:hypothetical protein
MASSREDASLYSAHNKTQCQEHRNRNFGVCLDSATGEVVWISLVPRTHKTIPVSRAPGLWILCGVRAVVIPIMLQFLQN